jgi:hypothetical protein
MGQVEVFGNKRRVLLDRNNFEDLLPREEAVYIIFSEFAKDRESEVTLNCLYVGETKDLRESFRTHFSERETNIYLKHFMKSCKSILVLYDPMPGSTEESRSRLCNVLNKKYEPQCNAPE